MDYLQVYVMFCKTRCFEFNRNMTQNWARIYIANFVNSIETIFLSWLIFQFVSFVTGACKSYGSRSTYAGWTSICSSNSESLHDKLICDISESNTQAFVYMYINYSLKREKQKLRYIMHTTYVCFDSQLFFYCCFFSCIVS